MVARRKSGQSIDRTKKREQKKETRSERNKRTSEIERERERTTRLGENQLRNRDFDVVDVNSLSIVH